MKSCQEVALLWYINAITRRWLNMDANSCNKKMPRNQSWQDFEKVAYQSHQKSINNVKLINERIEKLRKEIRSTKK